MNLPPAPAPLALPSDQDATGRTLGADELALIRQALESGTLTVTKGPFGRRLENAFSELVEGRPVVAVSSGSAAIHAAVAALDPEPGDEVVTTPITDMGALSPILYQGAIPVFADVDPRTGNVTADTVRDRLTPRTRAIVVTHLFGSPCDLSGILELADAHGLPVIEDCAQAFLATHAGRPVGSFGAFACFSLQQGKHVTAGEGGLLAARDAAHAKRARDFVNKAWGYGDAQPDHTFLALNYRPSELQTACALGQLPKLAGVVAARRESAARMGELLRNVPGVAVPADPPGGTHSFWKYPLLIDPGVIPGGPAALAGELKAFNVASAPRYIQKPAFRCGVFRDQKTFGTSRWPFTLASASAVDYAPARFAGAFEYLDRVLVLPWNERYTADHLSQLAAAVSRAAAKLAGGGE